jgi:hypothetical protein
VAARASSPEGDEGNVTAGAGEGVGSLLSTAVAAGSMVDIGIVASVAVGVAASVGAGETD